MYFNVFFYALLLLSGLVLRLAPSLRGRHPIVLLLGLNLILIGVYFYRSVVYFLPPIGFALAGAVLVPAFLPRFAATAARLALVAELLYFVLVKRMAPGSSFPVGISFVLFLCTGALIDRIRHRFDGERITVAEFLCAATFAPLLVAGPFAGFRDLRARMRSPEPITPDTDREAALLFVNGFFKKAIANLLFIYSNLGQATPMDHAYPLLAILSLPAFYYADFSGYSDMARGVALFLGIRISPNFRLPYLARSFAAFWQRWHISLGDWLRDYLYNPLFLVHLPRLIRSHRLRVALIPYLTLILTLLAINLWHGLTVKFLSLGLATGAIASLPFHRAPRPIAQLAVLGSIFLYQLVFWCPDLSSAWNFLGAMAARAPESVASPEFYLKAAPLLLALALPHWIDSRILGAETYPGRSKPLALQLALVAWMTGSLLIYIPGVNFVYSRY